MKILVVEDEAPLRRTLERALREEGFVVESAEDGSTGLAFALHTPFDLILLDVMLPGVDGFEILRRLREGGRVRTPVLMLTARDSLNDRLRGLDGGSDDYLVKPFDLAELLSRIRAVLRRTAGEPAPVFRLPEDVSLDTVARSVSRGGEPVELTAREYAILEWMARHRGRVVERDTLYAHVSSDEDDTSSNLIEVHVCNLRKKLGKGIIETRRGLGYVMPAD